VETALSATTSIPTGVSTSARWAVTLPSRSPTSAISQIDATQDLRQLGIVQLNALLFTGCLREFKRASLQPFVPNAKTVLIPEQDLDSTAIAADEQKQVARGRVLVENRLGKAHQAIEAVVHLDRRHAEKDANFGKIETGHDLLTLGRKAPTASITFTSTASPTPTGSRTEPPLGNAISIGDAVSEIGKNFGSANSASVGITPSSRTESGTPSCSRLTQR
jgi:hypothetical protein